MSLRSKTLLIIIPIFLLVVSLVNASTHFILLKSFSDLEETYSIKNIQHISDDIRSEETNLLTIARDYAMWDDTYTYIADHNQKYIDSNIYSATFNDLQVNFMIFLDATGKMVSSYGYDTLNDRLYPLPAGFTDQILADRILADFDESAETVGFLVVKDQITLLAAHTILTSKAVGPSRGTLIAGRFLDESYLAAQSAEMESSIQLGIYPDSQMSKELRGAKSVPDKSPQMAIQILSPESIAGYVTFKDIFGNPAVILRSVTKRDIYNQGYNTIIFFIYVVFLGSLLSSIAAILLLDKQILSRIGELSSLVKAVRISGSTSARVEVKGKDELSLLSREINSMLATIEVVEKQLRSSHEELEKLVAVRTDELLQVNADLKHEISERQLGENALFEAYNEIQMILSSITSIMIGVNNQGVITQWNDVAARLFGISSIDAIGQDFFQLPIRWDWETLRRDATRCMQENKQVRMEDIRLELDSETSHVLGIALTPLRLREDEPPGFLLLGADISERRLLEEQAGRSNRLEAIGELAAGVAHEINTPTQLVGSNLRFLGQQLPPVLEFVDQAVTFNRAVNDGLATAAMVRALEKAADAAHLAYFKQEAPQAIEQSLEGIERISRIVGAMRFFSHPGTDHKEMANLNQIIENALALSRNEWKNVAEIQTRFQDDLPNVECLPGELSQVVLNLIINAVHAIEDAGLQEGGRNGVITITSREEEEMIEIRIADNGTGIPEKVRSRIFDPFFTTKDVGRGTGQGLAIAHAVIVKKHAGTIEFETEVGQGTTFIIRLPRKASYD